MECEAKRGAEEQYLDWRKELNLQFISWDSAESKLSTR